jgi:hypothetical protein
MATKEEILDAISSMTVLELSELLKDFEERFGVTAAAPVAVAAPGAGGGGGGGAAEAEEEKDEFDVVLTGAGDKKIQVIPLPCLQPPPGEGLFSGALPRIMAGCRGRPSVVARSKALDDTRPGFIFDHPV